MGKILLVIDHSDPDEKSFKYAIQLCQSIHSDLSILYIIQGMPKAEAHSEQNTHAYVNEDIVRLIAESSELGIQCTLTVKFGPPDSEVVHYVESHRDIILAVYDRMETKKILHNNKEDKLLARDLLIPIVRVNAGRLFRKISVLKNILMEGKHMGQLLNKISNVFTGKSKSKMSRGTEPELNNNRTDQDLQVREETQARLVVVGNESTFSDEIVDYALEMAERRNYRIIALNTAPLSCDTFRLFSSSRNQVCSDFEAISVRNVETFETAAKERNIHFTHVLKFVEVDDALDELQNEFGEIGFIVSEPTNQQSPQKRNENEKRSEAEICVYAMR